MTGVNGTQTYGGNCADWQDSSQWTDGTKAGLMAFASASMDALKDWFFWTWKVSLWEFNSSLSPRAEFPTLELYRSAIPPPESSNLPCGRTSWVFMEVGCLPILGLS